MDEMESLGKYLRAERETKKISLKEVSKNIKVREPFLKAVEEDRYDLLPSPTYVKGFLAAYAKYLGLDPNEIILRYESFLKGGPVISEEIRPGKKISWNQKYLWVIGGVIVVGLVAFSPLLFSPSKPPMKSVSSKPEVKQITPPSHPPSPREAEKLPVPEEKPLMLRLKAAEKTWVSIQLDDQPRQDITLQAGEGISYRATKRIELVVGNAGGLDLVFNDRKLERVGKFGEVFMVIFTPQGVEAKRREKQKPPQE